ncbi:MAG: hypothetical protein ABS69_06795 [Nitrosomonadales bacterium SCN 54-20]|nr:MAG: hypothetical protein ABS69_06795 [Nitrosomonadales bacterium SCN 54-20]
MLQKDDLPIVYRAYQQTYPQQLWTIEKTVLLADFSGIFVHRMYLRLPDSNHQESSSLCFDKRAEVTPRVAGCYKRVVANVKWEDL